MGRLHISETICYIWPTHHSIPLSSDFEYRNSIRCLAATNRKSQYSKIIDMLMIHKTLPTYEHDFTQNFEPQFRPLPEVVAFDTYIVDPRYGLDTHWDEDLYDQDKLEYKDTYNKPNDRIESSDLITDAQVSDALRYALIDLWTVNPHLPDTSSLPNFQPRPQNQQKQVAVIGDQILPRLQVVPGGFTTFFRLSTNLQLKSKRKMLNFPLEFWELNIDGLIDTGALSSAIPEAVIHKVRLLAPHTILIEGPPPVFQNMVANGQCNSRIAIKSRWHYVHGKLLSLDKPYKPLDRSSIPTTQHYNTLYVSWNPDFSLVFNAVEKEDRTYPNVIQLTLNPVETTLQPGKRTKFWLNSQI